MFLLNPTTYANKGIRIRRSAIAAMVVVRTDLGKGLGFFGNY